MKVTGPGSGAPPDGTGAAEGADPARAPGGAFADRLVRTDEAQDAGRANPPARSGGIAVADLGAALEAGRLDPQAALDAVISRVIDRQVGRDAPPAVRE